MEKEEISNTEFISEVISRLGYMSHSYDELTSQLFELEQEINGVRMMYGMAGELENSGVKLRYFRNEEGLGYEIIKETKIGFLGSQTSRGVSLRT